METKIFLENLERKKKAIGLIHRVYLTQLKNARKYTASTKTKSEVRGGGRKPWKQKGTGRARAGSSRSPLFVGGGITFGPRPRIVSKKINKDYDPEIYFTSNSNYAVTIGYYEPEKAKYIKDNAIRNGLISNTSFLTGSKGFIKKVYP